MTKVFICLRKYELQIVRSFLYIVIAVTITACTRVINIDVKDEVSFSTFETSFAPSENSKNRIKIRASQASGNFSQTVPNGKVIRIEGTDIAGPTVVQGTTDLTYYSISFGRNVLLKRRGSKRNMPSGNFYLIWDAGLAQVGMDLALDNEGTRYNASEDATEIYGRVGLLYSITPSFDSIITLSNSIDSLTIDELAGLREVDLKLNYKITRHVGIMGGYRWLEYRYIGGSDSDIVVDFRGPFLGINIPL